MKKQGRLDDKKGVTLISLAVTIIVIIILAAISYSTMITQEESAQAKYVQEFVELRKCVDERRLSDSKKGMDHVDDSFSKVYLLGEIPNNFEYTTDNGNKLARLVSLDEIGCDELARGKEYGLFEAVGENIKVVEFGKDDVFVYDANGKLFYVKGFFTGTKTIYDDNVE